MQADSERAKLIGEKIKKLRLAHGMTQSELTGTELTRNMLSRIENGSALPSMGTLIYLSARLGIGAGYFLADDNDELSFIRGARIALIRKAFSEGSYDECIRLCGNFAQNSNSSVIASDDETALANAVSQFALAIKNYHAGKIVTALKLSAAAQKSAEQSIYSDYITLSHSLPLFNIFATSAVSDTPLAETLPSDTPAHLYNYIKLLNLKESEKLEETENFFASVVTVSPYRDHISSVISMRSDDILIRTDAAERLRNLCTSASSPFVLFRVYRDLEIYCRSVGDYKNAYEFSNARHIMIETSKE